MSDNREKARKLLAFDILDNDNHVVEVGLLIDLIFDEIEERCKPQLAASEPVPILPPVDGDGWQIAITPPATCKPTTITLDAITITEDAQVQRDYEDELDTRLAASRGLL